MKKQSTGPIGQEKDQGETGRPLVSIVVPAARVDGYLFEALSSALEQEYPELEVVLVLDGLSPQKVPSPIGGPHVQVLSFDRRQGTPLALNAGLQAARGSLIARLDADDLALPGRISRQVDFLLEHPEVGCVATQVALIEEDGSDAGPAASPAHGNDVGPALVRKNVLVHSSVMYRAALVKGLGGYSPSMLRMQDYELFLRLARNTKIAIIPQRLTAYRMHSGQFSRLTSPWKPYTRTILRERRRLARHLGIAWITQVGRDVSWWGAQVLRYYNFRAPGFRESKARR